MIRFLKSNDIWRRLTQLAKRPGKSLVAVAYFGQGAKHLLPLNPGSVLVVDCHPRSVRGGRTCPYDLLTLIRNKVEVHSCSNLHAKVFVFGNRAIIGSANASNLSKNYLLEAAVETTDKEVMSACREFINGIRGDQISPAYAKKLCKIWNPPKVFGPKRKGIPRFHPLWVVPLVLEQWDELANEKDRQARPAAKRKLRSRKRFSLNKFHWEGEDPLLKEVKVGHQIIQAMKVGKSHHLYRPSRVIHLKRYTKGGNRQLITYLETPRVKPAWRGEETVRKLLGPLGAKLVLKHAARRIKDPKVAHILFQLLSGQNME